MCEVTNGRGFPTIRLQNDDTASALHPSASAAQPVEAEDKSARSQNARDEQKMLARNAPGDNPQAQRRPEQPTGRHTTGSFTIEGIQNQRGGDKL
jgi:hypothetical protein